MSAEPAAEHLRERGPVDAPCTGQLLTDAEGAAGLVDAWRRLAVERACPGALPDWQLAWWRHLAPAGAELRIVAVFQGDDLVGLGPFFASTSGRRDYRLLGGGLTHRLSPLALPGLEDEVARVLAETLAEAEPTPDLLAFEGVDVASEWPTAVAQAWPGRRPWRYVSSTHPSPVLDLSAQGLDDWFASRSSNFRQQLRRARRKLEERRGRTVLAETKEDALRATEAFESLHAARWAQRGGSSFGAPTFAFLLEAARNMDPVRELRVWSLELDSQPVAVQIFLAAGGELLYFNGGFDDSIADVRPAYLTMLSAIEDAFARGERRLDFGGGGDDYKLRFATGDDPIAWTGLVPRTSRYALTRARLVPDQADWFKSWLVRKVPRERRRRLKQLLKRS